MTATQKHKTSISHHHLLLKPSQMFPQISFSGMITSWEFTKSDGGELGNQIKLLECLISLFVKVTFHAAVKILCIDTRIIQGKSMLRNDFTWLEPNEAASDGDKLERN